MFVTWAAAMGLPPPQSSPQGAPHSPPPSGTWAFFMALDSVSLFQLVHVYFLPYNVVNKQQEGG